MVRSSRLRALDELIDADLIAGIGASIDELVHQTDMYLHLHKGSNVVALQSLFTKLYPLHRDVAVTMLAMSIMKLTTHHPPHHTEEITQ